MTLELAMEYLKVALLLAAYPMGMCLMFCVFELLSEHSRGFRCFLRWIARVMDI
jgi:cytochrome c biogenesis protein CcdA